MRFIEYLTEDQQYGRKWTAEEIKSLPKLGPDTLESVCVVGKVVFDQINGLGSVPLNRNVVYRGFVGMMYPRDFSEFAKKADRDESAKKIVELISEGYGIGSPFLDIDVSNPGERNIKMKVYGHEGRARCVALNMIQPNILIPVHFFFSGLRARDITEEMIPLFNQRIMAEGSNTFVRDKIKGIWLRGKYIEL